MAGKRGQNEGSIYFDEKRNRWVGAVTLPDGTRKAFRGATRLDVSRKVATALSDLQKGVSPADDRMTVGQWLDTWLENTAKPNLRYSSYRGYEQIIRCHLKPKLGKVRLSRLSADDIEELLNEKRDAGLSPRTCQYIHSVLRAALKVAVRRHKVHHNEAQLLEAPSVTRQPVEPFTAEEAKAFLAAVGGHRFETAYTVALGMGLRLGETLGLKWEDIDLTKKRLWVRRALQRQKKKGLVVVEPKSLTSRRGLPLPAFVASSLKAHRKAQAAHRLTQGADWRDEGWVFTMENGRPVSPEFLTRHFRQVLKDAGIRHIRFHDLRHSCASFLFAQGCDLFMVKEILGHSQIALTANTYTHLLPEGDRKAAKAMDAALGEKQ